MGSASGTPIQGHVVRLTDLHVEPTKLHPLKPNID